MRAQTVTVNQFDGAINFTIELKRGLNVIAGENGTGKTRLLHSLKSGSGVVAYDSQSYQTSRIFAINPKRNSERHDFNQVIQRIRRENRSFANFSNEAINKHFDTGGFDNYSSFGELFYYYFDKLDKLGGDRNISMSKVVDEFNSVIEKIFREYKISAHWDSDLGQPTPVILKRGREVPLTGLSCGEAEIFSLALNLYSLRDQFDIFLIDEPETHLNWHLEKMLFTYFRHFCESYDKQLVVATHSRIVVDQEFSEVVQFLHWSSDKVVVCDRLPQEHREKLLDDAFQSLKIGGFESPTIFCEDDSHKAYFDALLEAKDITDYKISRCGSSINVKSLYRTSTTDGEWKNSLFIIDGDGQGAWKYSGKNFLQIRPYCIENLGVNFKVVETVWGLSSPEIQGKLEEFLKARKSSLFEKSKSLSFLVDLLKAEDLTQERLDQIDASEFFLDFIEYLGVSNRTEFWRKVFSYCRDGKLSWDTAAPQEILAFIDAIPKSIHGAEP